MGKITTKQWRTPRRHFRNVLRITNKERGEVDGGSKGKSYKF